MLLASDLQERIDRLRESDAYKSYEHVRERVLKMKKADAAAAAEVGEPSDYWQEELSGFEYLLDASPLLVEKLRHHIYHVTGLRVYDYRTHKDRARELLAEKLRALIEVGGRDLLVPESRLLGGFGHEIDGELYNVDTLKFYEVLIAMERGALLSRFREDGERGIVLEVGAGWGGFPYTFKKLCPNVTYVIVDLPELFLFSATYLMTAFPEASFAFFGDDFDPSLDSNWLDADFVFVPNTRLGAITPPRLDLTLNMVSFQEMTTEQVESYVAHAYRQGCPFLYSLNRERSFYNPELSGVHSILERYYWPHEIEVLPVSYVKMLDTIPKLAKPKSKLKALAKGQESKADMDYKHVVGWRRVTT